MTVCPDPAPVPDDDPVAEAALQVGRELGAVANMSECFVGMRVNPRCLELMNLRQIEAFEADQMGYQRTFLATAETSLRAALASTSGLSVVIGGRVYTSPGRVRNPRIVEAVNVALLTPAEGGNR